MMGKHGWIVFGAVLGAVALFSFTPASAVDMSEGKWEHTVELQTGHEAEIAVGKVPAPRSPGLKVHGVRTVVKGPAPERDEIMSLVDKAKMDRALQ